VQHGDVRKRHQVAELLSPHPGSRRCPQV